VIEIGLTGGIGSGKSTVAALLVERGARLIDADAIVREVQAPGSPVLDQMAEQFGAHILRPDGSLDRAAVAAIAFADPEQLAALNAIVHPAVTNEMTARRQALADTDAVVLLDIPLLVESGYQGVAGIIVVDVDPAIALHRLMTFRGFSEGDATSRMARQASRTDRLSVADFVVDNSGDRGDLDEQIEAAWTWITGLPRPAPGGIVEPIRGRAATGPTKAR
jgi:dephospho-CoA kinase